MPSATAAQRKSVVRIHRRPMECRRRDGQKINRTTQTLTVETPQGCSSFSRRRAGEKTVSVRQHFTSFMPDASLP
jgi:hypothetical protein